MARRWKRGGPLSPQHTNTDRTILRGDHYSCMSNITELCNRVAHATVAMDFNQEQLIDWLFDPDKIKRLRSVKGLVAPASDRNSYPLGAGCRLSMDFQMATTPTPMEGAWAIQPEAVPFTTTVAELKALYEQFCKVRYVANWLDANATPGAVRHYWPTMLSLAPNSEALKEASTFRYVEPAGISALLPLLRETAAIVVGALLLPKKELASQEKPMYVAFSDYPLQHSGLTISTPLHQFYLRHVS